MRPSKQVRILILGSGGFVGQHLLAQLRQDFADAQSIWATGQRAKPGISALDATDADAVRSAVRDFAPTHIFNLAGIAAPARSRRTPDVAWKIHAHAPEQLGRILLECAPECWLFQVGSGLIYGNSAASGQPMAENTVLSPTDTYGVTKAAGDLALGALATEGLKCLRLRPFNHTGPGQSEDFVVPAFSAQIAEIERGRQSPVLRVGNLEAVRDFLDVRDVVRAYSMLLQSAEEISTGSIFNIASGVGLPISKLLDYLVEISATSVTIESDPDRQRPSDLPTIIGDASELRRATGWRPAIDIVDTLRDTLNYFRQLA